MGKILKEGRKENTCLLWAERDIGKEYDKQHIRFQWCVLYKRKWNEEVMGSNEFGECFGQGEVQRLKH